MDWISFTVSKEQEGIRADNCVSEVFNLSFSEVQRLFRKGFVKKGGKKISASERVCPHDEVFVPAFIRGKSADITNQTSPINPELVDKFASMVIYDDKDLLVINKPSGLAVQSGTGIKLSVDDFITAFNTINNAQLKLVHRLDKSTSGVLVIAKGRANARQLTKLFAEKSVRKLYWAITEGIPAEPHGIINLPISKKLISGEEIMTPDYTESGLVATTKFKVIHSENNLSWLALEPITGRTHQLRVHCSSYLKTPIVGDLKYNSTIKHPMCLHGRRVLISEKADVLAPPPDSFFKAFTQHKSLNDFLNLYTDINNFINQ